MRHLACIYRLMISLCFGLRLRSFLCVLAVSLCAVQTANAENYYWTFKNTGVYDSPEAACADYSDRPPIFVSPTYYYCNSGGYTNGFAARAGDSCPSGYTEDKKTGLCNAPDNKCEALKGTKVKSFRFQSSTSEPTGTISKNGCAISLEGTGICVTRTAGTYDCTFSGTVTGEKLDAPSGQTSSDCSGEECTSGAPENQAESTPCVMIGSGGSKSCTSTQTQDNPGTLKCGTVNGSWACTESPKSTSKAEINKVTQTSTSNTDGSTTTTTTTNTTTTSCKGVGNCTTGTTTSTTTGGTNADGTSKGETTTCKGALCNGGSIEPGKDDKEQKGDDEEGEDESSVSGDMICTAVVACTGDVIQCAILRQEQQSRCADDKFRSFTEQEQNKVHDEILSASATEMGDGFAEHPSNTYAFDKVIDTSSRWGGGSCPVLEVKVVAIGDASFQIDPNVPGLCSYLQYIGYILVALTMMRALHIITSD